MAVSFGSGKLNLGGKLPSKRSINLIQVDEKKQIKLTTAIPAILLVVALAVVFAKFAVVDRLAAMSHANSQLRGIRDQLEEGYAKIEEFGELNDEYAHYTYAGMTEAEVTRVDRVSVIDLIQKSVIGVRLDNWSVQGNTINLSITARSLDEINQVMMQLNSNELVNFCTVTTAAKTETKTKTESGEPQQETVLSSVTGSIVVYLNDAAEEGEG